MKKTTYILVISIDYHSARHICEQIENSTFATVGRLKDELLNKDSEIMDFVTFYPITDFMDAVNNQDIDNLTESFISYVTIGEN